MNNSELSNLINDELNKLIELKFKLLHVVWDLESLCENLQTLKEKID